MESITFTVVIKTPDGAVGDIQIECVSNWDVARLKQSLTDIYPTHPEAQAQKLIFAGKLLTDDQLLSDAFRPV